MIPSTRLRPSSIGHITYFRLVFARDYTAQRSIIPLHLYSTQAIVNTMAWDIEVTAEFENWWDALDEGERVDVRAVVGLLEENWKNVVRLCHFRIRVVWLHPNTPA